jgi:hypothetical protein
MVVEKSIFVTQIQFRACLVISLCLFPSHTAPLHLWESKILHLFMNSREKDTISIPSVSKVIKSNLFRACDLAERQHNSAKVALG